MSVKSVTEAMTECRDLDGQAIVYCTLNGKSYVITKSIVRLLTDTDFLCGANPYIQRIIEKLPNDTVLLPVVGETLLKKVWDNPGEQKNVYFVTVKAMIDHLSEIFPDADLALLQTVRQAMQDYLQSKTQKRNIEQSRERNHAPS